MLERLRVPAGRRRRESRRPGVPAQPRRRQHAGGAGGAARAPGRGGRARQRAIAEVNHNYEREHDYNLWFVVTARGSRRSSNRCWTRSRETTGLETARSADARGLLHRSGVSPAMDMTRHAAPGAQRSPAARPDRGDPGRSAAGRPALCRDRATGRHDRARGHGAASGLCCEQGVIKRLGVVVRHRELGYRRQRHGGLGRPRCTGAASSAGCSASLPFVTLCYRRPRRLPDWPYNLFTMIHGRDRAQVLAARRRTGRRCCELESMSARGPVQPPPLQAARCPLRQPAAAAGARSRR